MARFCQNVRSLFCQLEICIQGVPLIWATLYGLGCLIEFETPCKYVVGMYVVVATFSWYLSVTFAQHSQIHSAKQQKQQINFGNTLICILFFRLHSHAGSFGQPHFFLTYLKDSSSHYDMVLILSSRYICMTWVFSCLFFLS